MTRRAREFVAERDAAERNAAGISRGERRAMIDEKIIALLADGPRSHAEVSRRAGFPRAATAARVKRLLRRREIAWIRGGKMLCLYRWKHLDGRPPG